MVWILNSLKCPWIEVLIPKVLLLGSCRPNLRSLSHQGNVPKGDCGILALFPFSLFWSLAPEEVSGSALPCNFTMMCSPATSPKL